MCLFLVRILTLFMGLTALWHGWKSFKRPVAPAYRSQVVLPPSEPVTVLPERWVNPAYQEEQEDREE